MESFDSLPNIDNTLLSKTHVSALTNYMPSKHAPRFLLLYGSLRERSYSKLLILEAARLLEALGAEVKIFDPHGLPLPDDAPETHPKVQELRELTLWLSLIHIY